MPAGRGRARPKPARGGLAARRRPIEPENNTTAASSPTTTPTAMATKARPTMPDQPGVGPLAIARLTAPTNRPKTSVSGTTTAIGMCLASATARVETSQASAAPSSTTTPAITCEDRSWRSPSSRHSPPPSHVSDSAILLVDMETPNISRTCPSVTGASPLISARQNSTPPYRAITPVRMPEFSHGAGAGSERSGTKDPPRRPPHTCRHDKLESRWVRCADRGDARRLLIDSLDHGSEHVGQPRYAHINGG